MVQEHTQLCWILGCLSTTQALSRLSQFKEKSSGMKEVPLGLYLYPVLQAADILLYKGTKVPVGEDNLQNVELSRRLARSFNNRFCKESNPIFPIPLPVLVGQEGTDEEAERRDYFAVKYWETRQRKGISLHKAKKLMRERNYFAGPATPRVFT